ncbi:MAG: hypothetical protein GY862_10050 [Gammaproteobacteria bacterium]|nr:hypothetical protein [Gammaproteobacteria bacterium]
MLIALGLWFRRDLLDSFLGRRPSRQKQQPQQFPVAGVDEKTIFHSIGLARDAQRLRKHEERPSQQLDIRATLEKTIRANDWFTPVYRQRKWMPEYLALIDRATFSDHQSQFADMLLVQLKAEGVVLNRYYFDCDPRYCYPEAHQLSGYTLPELFERHSEQRLLLFSDGAGLFDTLTGQPAEWLQQLRAWGEPSLFTLAAPAYWRIRTLTEENFLLFSANEQGMAAFAAFVENPVLGQAREEGHGLPALLSRLPQRWLARTKPDDDALETLISQLRN